MNDPTPRFKDLVEQALRVVGAFQCTPLFGHEAPAAKSQAVPGGGSKAVSSPPSGLHGARAGAETWGDDDEVFRLWGEA